LTHRRGRIKNADMSETTDGLANGALRPPDDRSIKILCDKMDDLIRQAYTQGWNDCLARIRETVEISTRDRQTQKQSNRIEYGRNKEHVYAALNRAGDSGVTIATICGDSGMKVSSVRSTLAKMRAADKVIKKGNLWFFSAKSLAEVRSSEE
jgi:hypothetical protein